MSQRPDEKRTATEDLSSLVDGEVDTAAAARMCAAWREDSQVRSQWHAYQLIGDVLRSEDLASHAAHDSEFLASLRKRLADEPVVLAPSPVPAVPATVAPASVVRARRAWATPAAVAAGFVVVAGTLVVTQMAGGPRSRTADPLVAGAPAAAPAVAIADAAASSADIPAVVLDGQLVRNVRLDQYLAAHKKFGGSSLPGGPSGYLRNAVVESPAR